MNQADRSHSLFVELLPHSKKDRSNVPYLRQTVLTLPQSLNRHDCTSFRTGSEFWNKPLVIGANVPFSPSQIRNDQTGARRRMGKWMPSLVVVQHRGEQRQDAVDWLTDRPTDCGYMERHEKSGLRTNQKQRNTRKHRTTIKGPNVVIVVCGLLLNVLHWSERFWFPWPDFVTVTKEATIVHAPK